LHSVLAVARGQLVRALRARPTKLRRRPELRRRGGHCVEGRQLLPKGGLVHGVAALGRRIVVVDPGQVARKRRRRAGGHLKRETRRARSEACEARGRGVQGEWAR